METIDISLSIPLDRDGFLEMECDFCKNRFMLSEETFKAIDNINFFCPICGLPNRSDTFYCPEVIEKAKQIAINTANEEIHRQLSKSIKKLNKKGVFKFSIDKPKPIQVQESYTPVTDYIKTQLLCCNIEVKTTSFDKYIGLYCPICGGIYND